MGTSSARKAPSTHFWRLAKTAARRYLAPEEEGRVEAREVVCRYLAALEGAGGGEAEGLWAALRPVRKAAQGLGEFWDKAVSEGCEAALASRGLAGLAGSPPGVLAQGLGVSLAGPEGGLEGAAIRTSLVEVVRLHLKSAPGSAPGAASGAVAPPARVVRDFLAAALYVKVALDLGEPLEAAASSLQGLKKGLGGLREAIVRATPPVEKPPPSGEWPGLAGWSWITGVVAAMVQQLSQPGQGEGAPD